MLLALILLIEIFAAGWLPEIILSFAYFIDFDQLWSIGTSI